MSRVATDARRGASTGVFLPTLSTWVRQALLAFLFLLLLLVVQLVLGQLETGNLWSRWYGGVAAGLLLLAALLSVRRRAPRLASRRRLGTARSWLDLHLAAGVTFGLLVALHVSFRLPHSSMGWGLWLLSWWTVLTGIFGLFVQKWVPRTLASGLQVEVLFERAPELVEDLAGRADRLVAEVGEPLVGYHRTQLASKFDGLQPRWLYLFDITGGRPRVVQGLRHLEERLDPTHREALRQLSGLVVTKLEIDAGYTLQRLLRWWLWLHVPTSLVLLLLVVLHVAVHLYY